MPCALPRPPARLGHAFVVMAMVLGCTGRNPLYRPAVGSDAGRDQRAGMGGAPGHSSDTEPGPTPERDAAESPPDVTPPSPDADGEAAPPSPDAGPPDVPAEAPGPDVAPAPDLAPSAPTPLARYGLDTGTPMGGDRGVLRLSGSAELRRPGHDPGGALYLGGGRTDYATLSTAGLPGFAQDKTVSFWFYMNSSAAEPKYVIVFASDSNAALEFLVNGFVPRIWIGSRPGTDLDASASATVGWNHLVYTYTATGTRHLAYLNNEIVIDTNTPVPLAGTVTGLFLGTVNPSGDGNNFAGRIDDLRIFNRPLSATEIDALYRGAP